MSEKYEWNKKIEIEFNVKNLIGVISDAALHELSNRFGLIEYIILDNYTIDILKKYNELEKLINNHFIKMEKFYQIGNIIKIDGVYCMINSVGINVVTVNTIYKGIVGHRWCESLRVKDHNKISYSEIKNAIEMDFEHVDCAICVLENKEKVIFSGKFSE